jgi:hypothetical protein
MISMQKQAGYRQKKGDYKTPETQRACVKEKQTRTTLIREFQRRARTGAQSNSRKRSCFDSRLSG